MRVESQIVPALARDQTWPLLLGQNDTKTLKLEGLFLGDQLIESLFDVGSQRHILYDLRLGQGGCQLSLKVFGSRGSRKLHPAMLTLAHGPDRKPITGENSPSHQQLCKLPRYGILGSR